MEKSTITQQNNTLMDIIKKSAEALGGVDNIRNLHTVILYGYAQYAYMWGGGNITASVDAPQKLLEATYLQRVWDFDNDCIQQDPMTVDGRHIRKL